MKTLNINLSIWCDEAYEYCVIWFIFVSTLAGEFMENILVERGTFVETVYGGRFKSNLLPVSFCYQWTASNLVNIMKWTFGWIFVEVLHQKKNTSYNGWQWFLASEPARGDVRKDVHENKREGNETKSSRRKWGLVWRQNRISRFWFHIIDTIFLINLLYWD